MIDRIRDAMAEIEDTKDIIEGAATLGTLRELGITEEQSEKAILGLSIAFSALDETVEAMERSE